MRWVFGPSFVVSGSAMQTAPPKLDPLPHFIGADAAAGEAKFHVDPYSLDTHNRLDEIRVYLIPSGASIPPFASLLIESAYPSATAVVAEFSVGFDVNLKLPGVPSGSYVGQVVYGYDA
jgi:hypothetical protein